MMPDSQVGLSKQETEHNGETWQVLEPEYHLRGGICRRRTGKGGKAETMTMARVKTECVNTGTPSSLSRCHVIRDDEKGWRKNEVEGD